MLKSKAWCSLSLSYLKSQLGSARFVRVSARLELVWLDSRLGSGSFFSENESLGSASIIKSLD